MLANSSLQVYRIRSPIGLADQGSPVPQSLGRPWCSGWVKDLEPSDESGEVKTGASIEIAMW